MLNHIYQRRENGYSCAEIIEMYESVRKRVDAAGFDAYNEG